MYMVGIEDRDYKEDKVECKCIVAPISSPVAFRARVVQRARVQHGLSEKLRHARTSRRHGGQASNLHRPLCIEGTASPHGGEDIPTLR